MTNSSIQWKRIDYLINNTDTTGYPFGKNKTKLPYLIPYKK